MSSINPRKYYDDIDNHLEIKNALRRDSYLRSFKCMYHLFFHESTPYVSSTILQKNLCIPDHARAFHILESFVILNLLEKRKIPKRRESLFFMINKDWWVIFYEREIKEVNDGTSKAD